MDGLVIGLDLNDDYTQICCYDKEKSWTIPTAVSYTHLDVYKRQYISWLFVFQALHMVSACSLSGTDKSRRINVVLFSRTSQWTI